jgi:hypothetical protein
MSNSNSVRQFPQHRQKLIGVIVVDRFGGRRDGDGEIVGVGIEQLRL